MVIIPRRFGHLGGHRIGHRAQGRMRIDLGHGEFGSTLPDARHQLGSSERPPTQIEEVRRQLGGRHAEDRLPLLGECSLGIVEPLTLDHHVGQRPRQRCAIDLAGGARRKLVDHREQRNQGGG